MIYICLEIRPEPNRNPTDSGMHIQQPVGMLPARSTWDAADAEAHANQMNGEGDLSVIAIDPKKFGQSESPESVQSRQPTS